MKNIVKTYQKYEEIRVNTIKKIDKKLQKNCRKFGQNWPMSKFW